MKDIFSANMDSGPQLFSFHEGMTYYGAYHLLTFTEEDRGKELKITVDSKNTPVCWIELWPATYDGHDWLKWVTKRGENPLVSTGNKPQPNPSITWKIEPGEYTVYFVASSPVRHYTSHDSIAYEIEMR
jgi:hypothetical protein